MDNPALRFLEPAKVKFIAVILLTSAVILIMGLVVTRKLIWEHYQQYAIKKGWLPYPQIPQQQPASQEDEVQPPDSDSLEGDSEYEVSQAIETRQVSQAWGRDKRYVTLTRRNNTK